MNQRHSPMRRCIAALLSACTMLLFTVSSAHAAPAAAHQPLRLASVVIHDPQINNVEALRFLAPAGWKVEGGVLWNHSTWLLATLSMRLSDPHSRASIIFHPADTFTWSPTTAQYFGRGQRYMGSLVTTLSDDVTETIKHVLIPAFSPELANAKIEATEQLPQLAAAILQQNQEPGFNKTCQAARIRFAYNDPDGTPMEEDFYAVVIKTPMPAINTTSWYLERSYSVRAEKGKLDALTPILTTMLTSAKVGEDWLAGYSYVVQLRNKGTMQAIQNAGELSRHIAQNAEDMRRMNREAYENAQHTQDRAARAFSQATRGVEDYAVPGSTNTRVELPSGYTHAWYDAAAGEYVLSDDPNFNPNSISNHTWTPVERAAK